jgi:hypothetical protein
MLILKLFPHPIFGNIKKIRSLLNFPRAILQKGEKMPQILVAENIHGIILAAENRAVELNEKGEEVSLPVNRLVPLSSHCALVAGGAAEGIAMANSLRNFIQEEGVEDVQDLYGAALPFLSTEYERFMRKKCEILPIDPLHHLSFILAGKTGRDRERPFRLYYFWTKKKLPLLDGEEISHAFSLPRRMGIEYQLNRLSKENATLEAMQDKVKEGIEKMRAQGEVGNSFSWAEISSRGYRLLQG